jgi:hypothetical protein
MGRVAGDAERGEAVRYGDAELELGGLTVEVAGGEPPIGQLRAVHLGLDAATAVVAASTTPDHAAHASDGAQGHGPRPRAGAG